MPSSPEGMSLPPEYSKEKQELLSPPAKEPEEQKLLPPSKKEEQKLLPPAESKKSGKEKLKVVFVSTAGMVESKAREVAGAKLTAEKESLKGFTGTLKKIWKYNIFRPVYRQKEIQKAKKTIQEEKNIFATELVDVAEHNQYMKDILNRFMGEYDEQVHKEAGEDVWNIDERLEKTDTNAIKTAIKGLIGQYALGQIDEANFIEEETRLFTALSGQDRKGIQKGLDYTSNLFEIAQNFKANYEHNTSLNALDCELEVIIGEAKAGARTETKLDVVDRLAHKMERVPVLNLLNEGTIAIGLALFYATGTQLFTRAIRSKAVALVSFGGSATVAASIAAAREGLTLEEERQLNALQRAKGETFDPKVSPRRVEMEKYIHEMADAKKLESELSEILSREMTVENFNQAMTLLTDIEARISLSDREKIDLLCYSNQTKVEKERDDLNMARARAKKLLKKAADDKKITLATGMTFHSLLTGAIAARKDFLVKGDDDYKGIATRNREFEKMKNQKRAQRFALTAGVGILLGEIAEEAFAFVSDSKVGVVEGMMGIDKTPSGAAHYSALESVRRYMSDEALRRMDNANMHESLLGAGRFKLPDGAELVSDNQGGYTLMRDGEPFAENLHMDANGAFDEASKELLETKGVITAEEVHHISTVQEATRTISGADYAKQHPELFTHIKRALWYDNDTTFDPATHQPIFDKNELRCDWGGVRNTGIDAHGNYVFNMKRMLSDGSYHGKFNVDAQKALIEGKIKMLLSATRDSQNQVFQVPILPNGDIVINPNDPQQAEIAKLLFENRNGRAVFRGAFAEVAESNGMKQGAESFKILATHVGENNPMDQTVVEKIPVTNDVWHTVLDMPKKTEASYPPIFPVPLPRTPMEPMKKKGGPLLIPPVYPKRQRALLVQDKPKTIMQRKKPDHDDTDTRRYERTKDDGKSKEKEKAHEPKKELTPQAACVILGLSYDQFKSLKRKEATAHLKKKYRKLARMYHPDLNQKDTQADGRFKEINGANDYLIKKFLPLLAP